MNNLHLPRYLVSFNSAELPHLFTGVLVIGSGVAGLRAAIEASRHTEVIIITKDQLKQSNTDQAQGGIAAAIGSDDSVENHIKDTLEVGCGICDNAAVSHIIGRAPETIREMREWGTQFDLENNALALAREGGHGQARVVHAHGDSTGEEIERALIQKTRSCPNIHILEHSFCIDLITNGEKCLGASVWQHQSRTMTLVWANAVVLATGGAGQIYRETTNQPIATGDGIAMACRAGCTLRDMEMIQFHPTTLYVAGAARVLISEAARGEGGILVNKFGEQFMERYAEKKELAPRDVVSRAILAEMQRTGDTNVYLDLTHVPPDRLAQRFPRIKEFCAMFDIDIAEQRIPVCPSAHYTIGGVVTDLTGATSLKGLYCAGESASTCLHGANRLASNSLLEGAVMGYEAGKSAGELAAGMSQPVPQKLIAKSGKFETGEIDLDDLRLSLRSVMWRDAGIVKSRQSLDRALERIDFWSGYVLSRQFKNPRGWRIQNMLINAGLVIRSAMAREESRGVHYRSDFPEKRDDWARHLVINRNNGSVTIS